MRNPALIPPDLLLQAYRRGCFPMADPRTGEVSWYTADPRAVLPIDPLHVPRRLARSLRSAPFEYSRDRDFLGVIRGCAERADSWINETIVRSYRRLHELGHAHSVEVWRRAEPEHAPHGEKANELVGGLYGVAIGGAFFGESMFHRESGAAKAALVHLAEHLNARGFRLLEIQMVTPLTEQFGARLVGAREYRSLLAEALSLSCGW